MKREKEREKEAAAAAAIVQKYFHLVNSEMVFKFKREKEEATDPKAKQQKKLKNQFSRVYWQSQIAFLR